MPIKNIQSDVIRVQHMLDAASEALTFVKGRIYEDLSKDRQLVLSLIKEIEIIGEAAFGVSSDFKKKHANIPWQVVVDTRHRLVHGYFDIDHKIVWQTVIQDLPPLIMQLKILLDK
jgi:uncharacterized protein with HEPN domain